MVLPRSTSMHLKSSPGTSPTTASDSLWFLQAGVRYFLCARARHTLAFVSSSISIVHNTAAAHCARAAAPREMERGGKRGKAVKRKREKKSVRRTGIRSARRARECARACVRLRARVLAQGARHARVCGSAAPRVPCGQHLPNNMSLIPPFPYAPPRVFLRANAHAPACVCALACWRKVRGTSVFAALPRRVRRAVRIGP